MTALSARSRRVPVRRRDVEIGHVRTDPEVGHVRTDPQTPGARSYLGDGRRVSWSPPRPAGVLIAVDAELTSHPVPRAIGRRFGTGDPLELWRLWTSNEVAAKLLDVPILVWLTRYGLRTHVPGITTRTLVIDDVVVSCGWCPVDTTYTGELAEISDTGPA